MAQSNRTCYRCRVAGHVAKDCQLSRACFTCGSPGHLRPQCPHQQMDISRQTTSRALSQSIVGLVSSRGVPSAGHGVRGRGGFVQRRTPLPSPHDAYMRDQLARGPVQEKVYVMFMEEAETRKDVVTGLLLNSADHTLMGKQTVSVDSDESGSNNKNADVESEDVEEEEPSEEDPLEEDEDEPQEVNSCEEPEEDPCVPNEDNTHEQELGRVASCEEEPNEMDSCGGSSEDERTGEQNEESCQEEPFEEDEQCEEEKKNEESCEEEPYEEDRQCEEEMRNMRNEESCEEEPCEEDEPYEEEMQNEACEEESYEEEMVEEPCEESEDKQCKEEPLEEEPCEEPERPSEEAPDEEAQDEEVEEELSEDPDEVSNEGSPVSQSYKRKDAKSIQSNSKKTRISSNIATEPERTSNGSGIHNSPNNLTVPVKLGTTARTGKSRQSKWDVKGEADEPAEGGSNVGTKKRKSRWSNDVPQTSLSSPFKHPIVEIDLQIPKLHAQLLDINKKLQSGVIDDQPQSERSPSPPPIYNNLGIKINTREARVRSKLTRQKQTIISKLIKKNSNFKPPPDYKTSTLSKKIFVPSKEYPGYNFVGLILGPRGNTQKKLEKETGARIKLRGRGSKMRPSEPEPSDNEDLHVLIEADDTYSLDAAVAMVEKLLIPVDDGHNEHKFSQLRELSKIRENLRENSTNNSKKPDTCNVCGDTSHPTSSCPLIAPIPGANSNGEKVNFAEMGSGFSPLNAPPPLSVCTMPSMNNTTTLASRLKKVIDDANLYVGCLPQSVDENALIELFSPFGLLSKVNVIRDKSTKISKGYGFVMYADSMSAAKAMAQMNGLKIDGKVLAVRIARILPPSHINQLPSYSGTSVITQNNPPPMCWPGPPESRLPETVASLSSNCSYPVHHNPFSGQYLGFQTPPPNSLVSGNFSTSTELGQFPGYLKSLDSPPLLHRPSMPSDSVPSSQDHFIHNFGCHQMPPT